MITVRLTGSHLTIGLRLEISLWIYRDRLLEVRDIYFLLLLKRGEGVVFVDLLTYINVKFRG